MTDVKITFSATDLNGKLVTKSYHSYLSTKGIKQEVANFVKRGMTFTIVNSYTSDVIAQSGGQ